MDIADQLQEAMKSGEVLEIVYNGGSKPGSKRRISPRSLSEDGARLRAYCIESEALKTFATAKIQMAGDSSAPPAMSRIEQAIAQQIDIYHAIEPYGEWLSACGWYVEWYRDAVTLHGYFKNGKPRKTPDVMICHNPENPHRPWCATSLNLTSTKSYSRIEKAGLLFLEQAEALAPTPHPLAEALAQHPSD